jgi:hypothetical protein
MMLLHHLINNHQCREDIAISSKSGGGPVSQVSMFFWLRSDLREFN